MIIYNIYCQEWRRSNGLWLHIYRKLGKRICNPKEIILEPNIILFKIRTIGGDFVLQRDHDVYTSKLCRQHEEGGGI